MQKFIAKSFEVPKKEQIIKCDYFDFIANTKQGYKTHINRNEHVKLKVNLNG